MFLRILCLWTMSIVGALSLALNIATNRFTYPNPSSMPHFHAEDRVNVTWISSFTRPWLQLSCDRIVTRQYYRCNYSIH